MPYWKPKFKGFCCMWNPKIKSGSLCDRNRMLDIDHDKKGEQAGTELGQAQPQLGLETKFKGDNRSCR